MVLIGLIQKENGQNTRKVDVNKFFIPEEEVIIFRNKIDLKEKLTVLLNNDVLVRRVAKNGQKRTIDNHSIKKRLYNK